MGIAAAIALAERSRGTLAYLTLVSRWFHVAALPLRHSNTRLIGAPIGGRILRGGSSPLTKIRRAHHWNQSLVRQDPLLIASSAERTRSWIRRRRRDRRHNPPEVR